MQMDSNVATVGLPLRGNMQVDAQGVLWIGGCSTVNLAETYGTPLFVYDESLIRETMQSFHAVFQRLSQPYQISYASKAFCTVAMCRLAFEEGCDIDVVSGGELYTALTAGVPPERIHLHGNNKTSDELLLAMHEGIGTIIVDNFDEIRVLAELTESEGRSMDVLLRISPGVTAHTHEFISTGQQDSKFGFDLASGQADEAMRLISAVKTLHVVGLHAHIGSQIFDTRGHLLMIERLAALYARGLQLGLPLTIVNVGGGFGIRYTAEDEPMPVTHHLEAIISTVAKAFLHRQLAVPTIWIEPGRSIVASAGTTLYRVGTHKQIAGVRNYVAVDGGMTDNPRLALYGAKYEVMLANRAKDEICDTWSVAGKCCESGDMVVWDAPIPTPQTDDVLAVFATGAYNYSMASNYNRIPRPAVVFVKNGDARLVVRRETWADVLRLDL